MSERIKLSHESNKGPENYKERIEAVAKDIEKAAERSRGSNKNERLERARSDAEKFAEESRKHGDELLKKPAESDEIKNFGLLQNHSYRTLLNRTQKQLPTFSKSFSKVIHQPVVEKVSEVAGQTIARPPGIMGAGLFAGFAVLGVSLVARQTGFSLSGSEFVLATLAGWAAGILAELGYKKLKK